jgi:type I restriction enzyme R subunit
MSELLDALIAQRKENALDYQAYLLKIVDLARQAKAGPNAGTYPAALDSAAKRALFDNLGRDETVALKVDAVVRISMQDDWRNSAIKTRRVRQAVASVVGDDEALIDRTVELLKSQSDY